MHAFFHWFWYSFSGAGNEAGSGYGWWSGPGADLEEVGLAVVVVTTFRHINCHVQGCWRLAFHRYEMDGTEYRLCHKHHPTAKKSVTAQQVADHHAAKSQ